jgi:perosamine synthetase
MIRLVVVVSLYQVIEDLAESFSGFEYVGHPSSDLTLFSFGSIKVCTGFGCGIARVRDRKIYDEMSRTQTTWAVQTRRAYFTKCVKNTLTMLALNVPTVTMNISRTGRLLNFDHRGMVVSMLRGFPDRLMERLRTQPSSALLATLHHRLANFDPTDFQKHQDVCDLMIELLPTGPQSVPGIDASVRNHWLFPVMVDHSDEVLKELNKAGIDTFKGATQLALIQTPEEVKADVKPPVSTHAHSDEHMGCRMSNRAQERNRV